MEAFTNLYEVSELLSVKKNSRPEVNFLHFSEARDQHENTPDMECQDGGRTRTTANILFPARFV